MEGFLGGAYLWVKAFHIIFVIFWMAGLFMMPRYLAYHCQYPLGSDEDQRWIERESKLQKIILNPAMIISWALGTNLVLHVGMSAGGWLHLKLLLVILLSVFHMMLARWRRQFAEGTRARDEKFFRKINEIPAVFIIAVVILAVTKAF